MDFKTAWMEKKLKDRVIATLKVDYRLVDPKDSKKILGHSHYKATTMEIMAGASEKSSLWHAAARDISTGGLSLLAYEPISKGSLAEVGLHLPQYHAVLKFLAQVNHVENFTEMGRVIHHADLRPLAVNKGDLEKIEAFLIRQMEP